MGPGQPVSGDLQLRHHLREMVNVLQQVESIIYVSVAALDHQNTERDIDVARVLQRAAGDRISLEIEKTRAFLDGPPQSVATARQARKTSKVVAKRPRKRQR